MGDFGAFCFFRFDHKVTSVVNENGCMEDTSFAETTDYDTDCVGESRFDKFMNQTGSK